MEILGIDVGGTGIKAALVDTVTGELITERYKLPTPQPSTPKNVSKTVKNVVAHFKYSGPIGCSFPTIINKGKALSAGNISKKWIGTQVDTLFEEVTGNQVFVANDADLAGVAEMERGAGRGEIGKVVMITIGTGLGSGVFMDGVLVPNIELGRMLHTDGQPIEYFASEAARVRDGLTIKKWAKRFDYFLSYAQRIVSADVFIIGGGVSKHFDLFKDKLKVPVKIKVAHHRNNAGIIGAAMLAEKNLNLIK